MKRSLDKYYAPKALATLVQKHHAQIPDQEFFNPAHQVVREAWCAAQFGIGYQNFIGDCEVKVNSGEFPDFFLRYNHREFWFENTEVLRKGRLRTKEYKEQSQAYIEHISQEEMTENEKNVPQWVKNAIEKKLDKYHAEGKSINLLLYVNINSFRFDIDKIRKYCMQYESSFQSIWIMTGKYVCTLFISPDMVGKMDRIDGFSKIETPEV